MSALAPDQLDCSCGTPGWSSAWRIIGNRVLESISHVAARYNVCSFDLRLRVLLHLPRYRWIDLDSQGLIYEEIDRLAKKTVELQRGFQEWPRQETISHLEKEKACVSDADEATAKIIHEKFHYICSSRRGRHVALYDSGRNVP